MAQKVANVDLEKPEASAERQFVPLEDRPELPPLWNWDEHCGLLDAARPWWRAVGPKVGGSRLEAWGRFLEEDTPEWCAIFAWKAWEALSGLTRADLAKLKEVRCGQPFLGCWPNACPHCGATAVAENVPPHCWWDHDGNCSDCGEHPFTADADKLKSVDGLLPGGNS